MLSNGLEIKLGRALAMCAHPYAAWRRSSVSARSLMLAAYTAFGYAMGTLILVTFGPS